jgi:hypothetical protein
VTWDLWVRYWVADQVSSIGCGSVGYYSSLAGEGSNLQPPDPKSGVLPVELPANWAALRVPHRSWGPARWMAGTAWLRTPWSDQ